MTNFLLIQKIISFMGKSLDKRFKTPFNIYSDVERTDFAKALGVCRDKGELCVYTDEDYVIPLEELTNRELAEVRKNLY